MFLPVMKYSIDMGATSAAAIGGIVAIIISYRLVKRINKSKLWSRLFDETEVVNEVVEEKKVEVEKEGSYNWKLISIVTILFAGLVYFNTFDFPEILQETVNKDNELELINQKFIQAEKNGDLLLNRYNTWTDLNDPNADIATLKSTNQTVTGIVYGVGATGGVISSKWEIAHINGVQEGLFKLWDGDGYLIHIKLFENGFITFRKNFQEGVLISIDIYEKGRNKIKRTIKNLNQTK
jgi:hypothetical protein